MRRFDKKHNIEKANLLAEQRYLESKGLIKEDINELNFDDTAAADKFDDYDDAYYSAEKSWKEKTLPRTKKKVLLMANEINLLLAQAVDGLGYASEINLYGDKSEVDKIEFDENNMTISYKPIWGKVQSNNYDLNDFDSYGDSIEDMEGQNLLYILKRIKAQLKKAISNIESKTNFYKYYVVDLDTKQILSTFNDKDWAGEELGEYKEDYPNAKVYAIKGLKQLGLEPVNVGGN
jgi:hypothetical protein